MIGYAKTPTLTIGLDIGGRGGNPAEGTINHTLGYFTDNPNGNKTNTYTKGIKHLESTCEFDKDGLIIEGSIVGIQDTVWKLKGDCLLENLNQFLEILDVNYGMDRLYTKEEIIEQGYRRADSE